ncbi:kelch repeat-containing protein [Streptomyces sp. NPDC048106]|uniref:Kelch repeat-containing protein n=1 Tax=Streptomyces sp. NPDC048106 TaxID=3155750 RepID=UPI0034515E81
MLDGKLYMIGGCTDTSCGSVAKAAAAYDPATDQWTSIAAYPKPVSFASCAGIEDKIYCAGGMSQGDELADTYAYDPGTDTWTQVADLPAPRWGAESAAANGQFLVVSGVSGNALDNKAYAFAPGTGGWSALPNVNVPSTPGGAAAGFYKVGGINTPGGAPLASVELLPGCSQETSDISWLSESTQRVTLAPGASTTVDVSLDASDAAVNQPGSYTARLSLGSDTPYALPAVPVTLTVTPPHGRRRYLLPLARRGRQPAHRDRRQGRLQAGHGVRQDQEGTVGHQRLHPGAQVTPRRSKGRAAGSQRPAQRACQAWYASSAIIPASPW